MPKHTSAEHFDLVWLKIDTDQQAENRALPQGTFAEIAIGRCVMPVAKPMTKFANVELLI